jgi:hypothetical protein
MINAAATKTMTTIDMRWLVASITLCPCSRLSMVLFAASGVMPDAMSEVFVLRSNYARGERHRP